MADVHRTAPPLLWDWGYPEETPDRKPTFFGVLRRYFVEWDDQGDNIGISKNWNEETCALYRNQYEGRILPFLDARKAVEDYEEADFLGVLTSIQSQYGLSESSMEHYRNLLWVVYRAGLSHGLYQDNIFWGAVIDLYDGDPKRREKNRTEVLTRLRKSFTVEEEGKLLAYFRGLDPELAEGEDVGQLIMYGFGYRNNEAAGLDCGCIRESVLPDGTVFRTIHNYQSTMRDSNAVKAGGKTPNSPRELPGLDFIFDFLLRRRDFLYRQTQAGLLDLASCGGDPARIPLVCRGRDYLVRCSSRDLSRAGRALFAQIGISKRQLGVLTGILYSDEVTDLCIEERDPTTYLYRRALGTHLYALGFTQSEIQYYIGHEIESPDLLRSDFINQDILLQMKRKLDRHPAYAWLNITPGEMVLTPSDLEFQAEQAESALVLSLRQGQQISITLTACEPNDPICVSLSAARDGGAVAADITYGTRPVPYPKTVDISARIQDAYADKRDACASWTGDKAGS